MNYTADQIALKNHLEAINVAAEGRYSVDTSPEWWAKMDIFSVEDYERSDMISGISDLYKEVNGFRPRHFDYDNMSFAQLQDIYESLIEEADLAAERAHAEALEAIEDYNKFIDSIIDMGAGDRETAIRWSVSGESFRTIQCVEHHVYKLGFLFTDFGRDLVKELDNIVDYEEV